MNKVLPFIRLDFITIKPYLTLKNLLIFSVAALIMTISSGASVSAIAILMVYAALYVSCPFAVGEQNGIDALYITLSIKRSTVVLGRYVFALVVDVCAGLFAYVFSFAVLTIMQKEFNALESLVVVVVMLLLYSIMQAFQLPIYFKLGYAKAKVLAYLPFIALGLAGALFFNLMGDKIPSQQITDFFSWLAANPFMAALLGIIVWFGIMLISYKTACLYYSKRDF